MKTALTIAGSDSSGGAGIQADLKTFTMNKVFGMSAVTSVTSQNTQGVFGVYDIPAEVVESQIDAVCNDIFPDSVKIGMVSSCGIISVIAKSLKKHNLKNIVLDTVMVSTSGCPLLKENAVDALKTQLFPLADIITPNIPEGEILCGFKINNREDMERAAAEINKKYDVAVLLKGGHLKDTSDDVFYDGRAKWFKSERINNENTHGTGCTLSSAIAANLAKGMDIISAVAEAKAYVTGALNAGLNLGKGSGPLMHNWNLK